MVTVPDTNGVDADFRIESLPEEKDGRSDVYELRKDAEARVIAERSDIWPLVYLRAGLYALTLLATAVLVIFPFVSDGNVLPAKKTQWISDLIRTASGFLPGWLATWLGSYEKYPMTLLIVIGVIGVLLFSSLKTAALINDKMAVLWRASLANDGPEPERAPSNELTHKERTLRGLRSAWRDYLAPALSAIAIVYIVVTFSNRWLFTALDEAGLVCIETPVSSNQEQLPNIPDRGIIFSFDVSQPCFATGYKVNRLDRYLVWTSPPSDQEMINKYKDVTFDNKCSRTPDGTFWNRSVHTDARGYSTFINGTDDQNNSEPDPNKPKPFHTELDLSQRVWSALLLPLRRHYGEPWFRPVARYGAIGSELDFLEPDLVPTVTNISENVVPSKVPGELFFYFNDAVIGLPWFQVFYADNMGCARFFVLPK